MRRRQHQSGYTLVELMIVVAIIGVLGSLATYGVQRYLASAKSAEARVAVGAIARAAVAAYERESPESELVKANKQSKRPAHNLCGSAKRVPKKVPKGRKYQPNTKPNRDFNRGSDTKGWPCLRFEITQPIYYQYNYRKGKKLVAKKNKAKPSKRGFEASAVGDVDGDGVRSFFALTGDVNKKTKAIKLATTIYTLRETE